MSTSANTNNNTLSLSNHFHRLPPDLQNEISRRYKTMVLFDKVKEIQNRFWKKLHEVGFSEEAISATVLGKKFFKWMNLTINLPKLPCKEFIVGSFISTKSNNYNLEIHFPLDRRGSLVFNNKILVKYSVEYGKNMPNGKVITDMKSQDSKQCMYLIWFAFFNKELLLRKRREVDDNVNDSIYATLFASYANILTSKLLESKWKEVREMFVFNVRIDGSEIEDEESRRKYELELKSIFLEVIKDVRLNSKQI